MLIRTLRWVVLFAAVLLPGCYDYWADADIRVIASGPNSDRIMDEVVKKLIMSGFEERFFPKQPQPTDRPTARVFAKRLDTNEGAGVYLTFDKSARDVLLTYRQYGTRNFSDTTVQAYRDLVNNLKSEFGSEKVIAERKTKRGQVLLMD